MKEIFDINDPQALEEAMPEDIIALNAPEGLNRMFVPLVDIQTFVTAVVEGMNLGISGPTGTGKSSFLLSMVLPENFNPICKFLGYPIKKLVVLECQLNDTECASELHFRRAIGPDGASYYEETVIYEHLKEAIANQEKNYMCIWYPEMGRNATSLQHALLPSCTKGPQVDSKGTYLGNRTHFSVISDHNYQAIDNFSYLLAEFDTALKSRFTVGITMNYLSFEMEHEILLELREDFECPDISPDFIEEMVSLSHLIRAQQAKGNLQSIAPPTFRSYETYMKMANNPNYNISPEQLADRTFFNNATSQDLKIIKSVKAEIYGLHYVENEFSEDPFF